MAWHEKLKMALSTKGLDGSKVARRLIEDGVVDKISPQSVNAWLRGDNDPDLAPFFAMCQYAGVSCDWVLDDREPAEMAPVTRGQPGIIRELAPGPPSPRKAKPEKKRPDPPAAGGAVVSGPRRPRAGGGKADVDTD